MGVSWLQILSSAKPISYCQIPRSVKIFILTLSFFACNADSVYAKQAVNKQSAVLSVISGSDNTGTVAPIDSRGAKESDKGQVNNGDISLRELIMLIIALVGWLLYAYTRKKIPADEEAKRTAQKNVDKQEEKVQQKNDYDGYKNLLKKVLGYISLPGLSDAKKISIDLDDNIFVPLRFSSNPTKGNPDEIIKQAFHDGRKLRMLLIIGEAGAGKTTLLKYYALCAFDTCKKLGFSGSINVFYLPLRDLIRSNNGAYDSLQANLSNWSKKHHQYVKEELFNEWLKNKTSLILLDGLDEISDTKERKEVCLWIDNAWNGISKAYFVVTSRLTGYNRDEGIELEADYERADVLDFSAEQQKVFLTNWFTAAVLKEPCEKGAKELTDTMIAHINAEKNKELRKLAAIPLILQIMAILWKERDYIPKSRVKLYDAVIDYLLEVRDEKKELKPLLSAAEARVVLCPISFWMQAELLKDRAEKKEMQIKMQESLDTLDNPPSAATFCDYMIKRAGLFVSYGNDYGFKHKTFREYLASIVLVKKVLRNPDELDVVVSAFGHDWWDEPIKFFIAQGDGELFNLFMDKLIHAPQSESMTKKQQFLLQTLIEEAPQKKIDALCAKLLDPTNSASCQRVILDCLKAIGRPAALNVLQQFKIKALAKNQDVANRADDVIYALQEPQETTKISGSEEQAPVKIIQQITNFEDRPSSFRNQYEHNSEYILIPGGRYIYSETGKEEPVTDLYVAKYPVTNKLYRSFIAALGNVPELKEKLNEIAKKENWLAGFEKYHEGTGDLATLFRSEYDEERKFDGEDQPVVGVTWYAARAYCLWLSLLENKDEKINSYRLPTEIEWEWAAGGRQGTIGKKVRQYPWADEKGKPTSKLLNYDNNVGATTPVGSYPDGATPEGLYDMAGNVWEWSDSWYDEKTRSYRVIRGGSWGNSSEFCRSANRHLINPGGRDSYLGFRLVFVP